MGWVAEVLSTCMRESRDDDPLIGGQLAVRGKDSPMALDSSCASVVSGSGESVEGGVQQPSKCGSLYHQT